jgi:hypothetical protein
MAKLKPGDVIAVERGFYKHFGVYTGMEKVIHYAPLNDNALEGIIHETTLIRFLKDGECLVYEFPETYQPKRRKKIVPDIGIAVNVFKPPFPQKGILEMARDVMDFVNDINYYRYSEEETVARAISRLGENKYSLAFNNCEHFAVWCKTGISESTQVERVLDALTVSP